jgi:hypothetical protein
MYVVITAFPKHCYHMHSNPALYLSSPGLALAPDVPAILRFFMTVLNSTQALGQYIELRCACFRPPLSQFTIHLSYI